MQTENECVDIVGERVVGQTETVALTYIHSNVQDLLPWVYG